MSTPQFPVPGGDSPVGPPPPPATAPAGVPAAPPGAYGVPAGGYPAGGHPVGGYQVPPAAPPAPRTTGAMALIVALIAVIIVPIVAAVMAYQIGAILPNARIGIDSSLADDLSILTPVRTQVLWAEVAFWSGTVLGVGAIVLGIIAAAKRRGRGLGVTAIVLAVLGPFGFFLAVSIFLGIGAAASASGGI
ncbi:hypothetical protein QF046_003501 [Microbacterium sp. W4I4]|uniref:hypothetical protein n=1 Tax=Microbacterium sp. W4I4 TaxID=3042295 RepID=UPI002782FF43|nr:hypothetical protein [Microbacterium sp. W4I4]MDQ0615860.1 hypothetical protein [Microbacterium sp. W4I4]